jgi:hypothetical protein
VEHYQYLSRSDLDRLRFAAPSSPGSAVIGFMPLVSGGESLSVALNVQVGSEENHPPVLQSASVETGRNIPAFGVLSAKDPEGDPVSVTLIEPPKKGTASFDGLFFRYDPFHNRTGDDYFIVRAADSNGAWSAEATVGVSIARQRLEFYYADMTAHPYQFAALMLHKEGVYTGRRVGDSYFFEPDGVMNRGEFITMLITAAGLAGGMTPTVNTGLLNDGEIPAHLKRYVKRAVDEGIISPELSFYYDEIPSRAEAVVLADRAAKISDVKAFELSMPDSGEIPDWATPSYRDLAAYRMLDLYDGYARPGRALDNGYAAGLIWQLYKHARR